MPVQSPLTVQTFNPQLGEVPIDASVQRANAGFLAPGQTKLSVCVDNIVTTSATVFFVPLPQPPAGKVWIWTDVMFSHTAATGQRFALVVGGITVVALPAHGTLAPDLLNGIETQQDCPGGLQPVLQITGVAAMNSFAMISGIQQNVGAG